MGSLHGRHVHDGLELLNYIIHNRKSFDLASKRLSETEKVEDGRLVTLRL